MNKHHPENEQMKHRYLEFLKNAKGLSEQSLDSVAKSLARFEEYNKYKPFKLFHIQQAIGFKNYLAGQHGERSGEELSKATQNATLKNLKHFFEWLYQQPGFKSRFQYTDAEYFNLSKNDVAVATAKREKKFPTLEQVKHVIAMMPTQTDIERRNRALLAFAILTGARDGAMASAKLKYIDLQASCFNQDARGVNTKNSKTFNTTFFPVGDDIRAIIVDWVTYLREVKLWGNDDPLFPATEIENSSVSHQFEVKGLKRECWSNASPIRTIFREAFERADLPYFNPHSFRDTLVQLAKTKSLDIETFKAWSQNLGHESMVTTLGSYGYVAPERQKEIIQGLADRKQPYSQSNLPVDVNALAKAMVRELCEIEKGGATTA